MILVALALAVDAPPAPATPAPGDCASVEALRPGPVTRACASLSVPPATFADLLAAERWGQHVADVRRLDVAACEAEVERQAEIATYWRTVAERPAPVEPPPAAWLGVGVGAGVALSLGTAWAWGVVAGAQ